MCVFFYSVTKTLKKCDDSDDSDDKPEVAGVISWACFVMTVGQKLMTE